MSNPQEDLDESPEGPLHFSSQPHEVQGPVSVSSRPGKAFGLDAQRVAAEEEWLALADCVLMHVSTRKLKAQAKRRRQSKVTETRSLNHGGSWELGTDLCAGHALQTTSSIGVQAQG
ncbi:hypothetical protein BHM03_00027019 [Ensete ventricosum]|nr:hypothetical protein BHM03_00027019 [Ensete ventricosum]